MSEKIQEIQNKIDKGEALTLYSTEELKYIQKPIGKAIYKNAVGRPKKDEKAKPSDRVVCDICGGKFVRSHRWDHNKTKVHQAYSKMNDQIRKLLLADKL